MYVSRFSSVYHEINYINSYVQQVTIMTFIFSFITLNHSRG
ncbi:hypothetical protein AKJ16_DCAP27443 [Drosera capensis]